MTTQRKEDKLAQKDMRFELTQKYTTQFIFGMRPYIIGSMDVENDGNCGFRVVASALGFGRKHWRKVRIDLLNELKGTPELYEALYGGQSAVDKLCKRINHSASNIAPKRKWMDLPDMGHLIATCYGVVVVNLSDGQCFTFLPLREYSEGKPMEANLREIGLGFVNNDHFVQICLLPGHPLPPVTPNWIYHADDKAKSLYLKYQDRFQQYDQLPHPERVTNISSETVQLDDDNELTDEIVQLGDATISSKEETMHLGDD
ncbi:uncharacterized protein LOC112197200 [Rosa chinensis]|uniref:uncharacterized protein LOC112197200 n=1 Tax=Rosa chinensis TaxID=74649 RepID=UPI001AD927F6|nr:uncharacterized protein LOC112197200 [Rosa chinensis]